MQQKIIKLRQHPSISRRLSDTIELDLTDEKTCLSFCKNNDPTLSKILKLNESQLEELIEILSNNLNDSIKSLDLERETKNLEWITRWIYCLLACLLLPLEPDVHNSLRMIARSCITIISRLTSIANTSEDLLLPWKLIIVVIAINFQQFDLLSL